MFHFSRKARLCFSLAVTVCLFLLTSGISYAHSNSLLSMGSNSPLSTGQNVQIHIITHGQEKVVSAQQSQNIAIPEKNGITAYLKFGYIPSQVKTSGAVNPSLSLPYNGCGTAYGQVIYRGAFNMVLIEYTVSDFVCNNAVAITTQLPPTDSGTGAIGVTLQSHSKSTGWIQKPWSVYATGDYDFLFGIPTPWGGIGSSCSGSISLHMIGDGPYNVYYTNC